MALLMWGCCVWLSAWILIEIFPCLNSSWWSWAIVIGNTAWWHLLALTIWDRKTGNDR